MWGQFIAGGSCEQCLGVDVWVYAGMSTKEGSYYIISRWAVSSVIQVSTNYNIWMVSTELCKCVFRGLPASLKTKCLRFVVRAGPTSTAGSVCGYAAGTHCKQLPHDRRRQLLTESLFMYTRDAQHNISIFLSHVFYHSPWRLPFSPMIIDCCVCCGQQPGSVAYEVIISHTCFCVVIENIVIFFFQAKLDIVFSN